MGTASIRREMSAGLHFNKLGPPFKGVEQAPFRPRHKGLQAKGFDLVEQGRAAGFIKVGRGFIQQQDRLGLPLGKPRHLSQDEVQHQRLLLARRALGGGPVLLAVYRRQVGTVRTK